jgi:DNA-directed RNA polymerase subunit beta'
MTRIRPGAQGFRKNFCLCRRGYFSLRAYGSVDLQAAIKVRARAALQDTSVGRAMLSDILPD